MEILPNELVREIDSDFLPVKLVKSRREVKMHNWLEEARMVSDLSVEDCARALYQSVNSFRSKEENPGTLTLNEIRLLMKLFNDDAKQIAWKAFLEFKP